METETIKLENLIAKVQKKLLYRNRTTIFDFIRLLVTKQFTLKEIIVIFKNPISIWIESEEIDSEEQIDTEMGLKILSKYVAIDYKGNIHVLKK